MNIKKIQEEYISDIIIFFSRNIPIIFKKNNLDSAQSPIRNNLFYKLSKLFNNLNSI